MDDDSQLYFEDFKLGDRFRSPGRTIGEAHYLFFAGMTGDDHPFTTTRSTRGERGSAAAWRMGSSSWG